MKKVFITCIMLIICAAAFAAFSARQITETDYAMNTVVTITARGANAKKSADAAFAEIRRIERMTDAHNPKSELSKLNESAHISPVRVSDELFSLIELSQTISEKTDGAFDITVFPATELWKITSDNPRVPSDSEISAAADKIGYQNIVLDSAEKTVYYKKEGMKTDLGAVAKGYAADRAAEKIRKSGTKNALLDLGGNIYALGKKSGGKKWNIGLQTPWKSRGEYFKTIQISDESAVTAGAYERYFEKNGIIYHHIFNPKTGMPAESDIQSATVCGKSSAICDALATAVFVGGKEMAETVMDEFKDYTVIVY